MKLKIVVVDFEIPPRVKLWALRIGIPVALVGAGAIAHAAIPFKTGDMLQAADLNTLAGGRLVAAINGKSYSVGATKYVAQTVDTYTGALVGKYAGAKALCETAATSMSAHMCTAEELNRSAQAGIAMPTGWYSSMFGPGGATDITRDCQGWNTAVTETGPVWVNGGFPSNQPCSASYAVLCCD